MSTYLARPQTADSIRIARSWSLKALQTADSALRAAGSGTVPGIGAGDLDSDKSGGIKVCMQARSVGSYNLGMLAEVSPTVSVCGISSVHITLVPPNSGRVLGIVCSRVTNLAVGMVLIVQLEKDDETAVAHYKNSGESARRIGFRQGQQISIEALRRVSGSATT